MTDQSYEQYMIMAGAEFLRALRVGATSINIEAARHPDLNREILANYLLYLLAWSVTDDRADHDSPPPPRASAAVPTPPETCPP